MPKAKAAFAATALLAAHAILRAADLPFSRGELLNPWELHRELRVDAAAAPAVQEFFLSFLQYQDLVLFHPTLGYYSSGRVSFTQDYRTFPDALSPYFGQMVAQHIFDMWLGMRKAGTLTANEPFTIAEFGAGDGALAESILNYADRRAAAAVDSTDASADASAGDAGARWREFAQQTVYACYDRSAALSAQQSQRNARFGARFQARSGDATDPTAAIAAGSLKGIVLSNELPDAFSVHKVVLSPSGSAEVAFVAPVLPRTSWTKLEKDLPAAVAGPSQERRPHHSNQALRPQARDHRVSEPLRIRGAAGSAELGRGLRRQAQLRRIPRNLCPHRSGPGIGRARPQIHSRVRLRAGPGNKGFAAYINLGEGRFIQGAGRILKAGYVVTIDYGSNWDGVSPIEFDHLRTYGPGTRRERPDPYHSPTLNDITTDVNFSHVVEEGRLAGLRPVFFGSQHTLLTGTPIVLDNTSAGARRSD